MQRIIIIEHERLARSGYSLDLLDRLQQFDELRARYSGSTIFDWSRRDFFSAKGSVGIIEIPGLVVEILPKIERNSLGRGIAEQRRLSRRNLLFMLSYALDIDFIDRDIAQLTSEAAPLIEPLTATFARRLLDELRRGLVHEYIGRDENATVLNGRLLVKKDIQLNSANRTRFYVHKDDYVSDSLLNQILKSAARLASAQSRNGMTRKNLAHALLILDQVGDRRILPADFRRVKLSRQSIRFRPLLEFSQVLLNAHSPSMASGLTQSFALLFPMAPLFEEFVARFLRRHAEMMGFSRGQLVIQARGNSLALVYDRSNRGRFWLRPDLMVLGADQRPLVIIDTKWKLRNHKENEQQLVAQSDAYQLFAYAMRYQSPDNVLLYPKWANEQQQSWQTYASDMEMRIRIDHLDIGFDLRTNRERLCSQLRNILFPPTAR